VPALALQERRVVRTDRKGPESQELPALGLRESSASARTDQPVPELLAWQVPGSRELPASARRDQPDRRVRGLRVLELSEPGSRESPASARRDPPDRQAPAWQAWVARPVRESPELAVRPVRESPASAARAASAELRVSAVPEASVELEASRASAAPGARPLLLLAASRQAWEAAVCRRSAQGVPEARPWCRPCPCW
jgi:hypothetical protein